MAEQGCQAVWGKVGEGGPEGASHLCLEGTCIQTEKTAGEGADTGARLKQWEAWAVQAAARITRDRHRHRQKAHRGKEGEVYGAPKAKTRSPFQVCLLNVCVHVCVCMHAHMHALAHRLRVGFARWVNQGVQRQAQT